MSTRSLASGRTRSARCRPRGAFTVLAVAAALLACDRKPRSGNSATTSSASSIDTGAARLADQMLPASPTTAYSLIELVANPERFPNGRVNVAGFLVVAKSEFDTSQGFLSLSREDYEVGLGNEVKIQFEHCGERAQGTDTLSFEHVMELNLRYVRVKGFFTPPLAPKGRRARSPLDLGTICATSVMPIEPRPPTGPNQGRGPVPGKAPERHPE